MDFLLQYSDGLPDDFFNDVKKQIVEHESMLLFVPDAKVMIETSQGKEEVISNGIFVTEVGDECPTTGFKFPQKHSYEVVADLYPAEIVYDWVEKFYTGQETRFPHVPKAQPSIPPSRYAKSYDFFDVYQYFISNGYEVYNATIGQVNKFPESCVDSMTREGKYIVNYYQDFEKCLSKNCIMLDFNPYNPTGIMSVSKVVILSESEIAYSRLWKDKEVDGVFRKRLKRYHYNVWGPPVLGKNYYNRVKVQSFDIVVKSFASFESVVDVSSPQYRGRQMISDPVLVDTYIPIDGYSNYRSNLYKLYNGKKYEEHRTHRCLMWANYDINYARIENKRYVKLQRDIEIDGVKVDLNNLHANVVIKRKANLLKQDPLSVFLADRIYVVRHWVSLYDGEIVKRDKYAKRDFVAAYFELGEEEETQELIKRGLLAEDYEKKISNFDFVPFRIARYPTNAHGTLVNSLFELTLEEFMFKWSYIYKQHKFPGWLERNTNYISTGRVESVILAEEEYDSGKLT